MAARGPHCDGQMNPHDRAHVQSLIASNAWADARNFLAQIEGPDDIEWLSLRAEVESGEGNLEAAAKTYSHILEMWPEDPAALYNASVVFSDLGRHEDAMLALEALIEVEGESATVLNDLSYEYIEAGHNVPGSLAASRAEALATDELQRCRARLNAATAFANMGRRADARMRLDAMLKDCTNACGEREAALELRQSIDPRHQRRSTVSGGR